MVYLQRPVNWQAGQELVLTTTALRDTRDWHRNEVLSIAEVLPTPPGVGAALRLSSAAQYAHEANDAYQGEVALLTRTIVVQVREPPPLGPLDPHPLSSSSSLDAHPHARTPHRAAIVLQGSPADSEPTDASPASCSYPDWILGSATVPASPPHPP